MSAQILDFPNPSKGKPEFFLAYRIAADLLRLAQNSEFCDSTTALVILERALAVSRKVP